MWRSEKSKPEDEMVSSHFFSVVDTDGKPALFLQERNAPKLL